MANIVEDVEVNEEQAKADLLDRRTFVGGSDAPVIVGLSYWKSRYQLYLEKTGQAEPPDLSEVERVIFGNLLEDVVAREFARRTGKKVRRVNNRVVSKTTPWMVAQIDRAIVGEDAVLECKTADAGIAKQWGDEDTEEIPPTYYIQVQHQLMVTGKGTAYVAVLIGGNKMKIYTVKRNDELITSLAEAEKVFWNQVQTRTPPEPIDPDEAALRWASAKAEIVEGTPIHGALAAEYLAINDQIKELKARQDAIQVELQKVLQDIGDTLTVGGKPVASWKEQTSKRLDQAALKEELPEIAEKYTKEKTTRVFRALKAAKDFMEAARV